MKYVVILKSRRCRNLLECAEVFFLGKEYRCRLVMMLLLMMVILKIEVDIYAFLYSLSRTFLIRIFTTIFFYTCLPRTTVVDQASLCSPNQTSMRKVVYNAVLLPNKLLSLCLNTILEVCCSGAFAKEGFIFRLFPFNPLPLPLQTICLECEAPIHISVAPSV